MKIGSGGSVVGSAQITDDSIVNADINSAAAIAQTKVAGSSNGNTDLIAFERTAAATHSLTTVTGQRVLVIATGNVGIASATTLTSVTLKYNGVTKATIEVGESGGSANNRDAFCLTYSEVPGAATANITIECADYGPTNCAISVIKIKG
jgi:hypothetical protein